MLAWWLTACSRDPKSTAQRTMDRVSALLPVTAAEIVGNYVRGIVLFGQREHGPSAFTWRSFSERAIITPSAARVPKRLRPIINRSEFEIRVNADPPAVIRACQQGRNGWLTDEAVEAYLQVHFAGHLGTVEAYRDEQLVGGLWGLRVGHTLGIMSMFHTVDHAGAVALAAAVQSVGTDGPWSLIDCGELSTNFARYGAYNVPTAQFCELVLAGMARDGTAAGSPVNAVGR
jgi:leucyl/phenylalanyl-tRNA--protein transferase